MTTLINRHISRRQFNKGLGATTALIMFASSHAPSTAANITADGLLHMDEKGKVHIYSGVGNLGHYGTDNVLSIVSDIFNCTENDSILCMGGNPAQLPALLAQHSNHMSFSSAKTIEKAALLLKKKTSGTAQINELFLENGISIETKEMALGIKSFGITVAVKEVA